MEIFCLDTSFCQCFPLALSDIGRLELSGMVCEISGGLFSLTGLNTKDCDVGIGVNLSGEGTELWLGYTVKWE